jgi:hypothetical protein
MVYQENFENSTYVDMSKEFSFQRKIENLEGNVFPLVISPVVGKEPLKSFRVGWVSTKTQLLSVWLSSEGFYFVDLT